MGEHIEHSSAALSVRDSARTQRQVAVGLLTPYIGANLGDAAIQDSMIAAIRGRLPHARIVGLTMNPFETSRIHGIEAQPITGISPRWYAVKFGVDRADYALDRIVGVVSRLFTRLPFVWRFSSSVRGFVISIVREPRHIVLALGLLRRLDLLVVAGGGQLDEHWGGPLGHPYALWKWALLAKLTRTRFVVLSVGAGSIDSGLARFFLRQVLNSAAYRSFRDDLSAGIAKRLIGTEAERVVPDLAFAYPLPNRATPNSSRIRTIGVSPIAFHKPAHWPASDPGVYAGYLATMQAFTSWLLDRGYAVVLFATDRPDHLVIQELMDTLGGHERLRAADTTTLNSLFDALEQIDMVVASRLHGIILSHLAGRPVVAVSYDWKVDQHMKDLGQGEFIVPIRGVQEGMLREAFVRLEEQSGHTPAFSDRAKAFRAQVQHQYDSVLCGHERALLAE